MKLFILTENALEYNDEYHYQAEDGGGTPVAAFRKRENAQAECDRRNGEKMRTGEYESRRNEPLELFSVTEVEVSDDDVVTYSAKLQEAKKAAAEAAALAKGEITKVAMEAFDAHPCLLAFRWSQYTPHFNDGETCEFRVNDASVKCLGAPSDQTEDGFADEYTVQAKYGFSAAHVAAKEAVAVVMKSIDEVDFEKVFGDHVEVTATREGFTVEEHEHD